MLAIYLIKMKNNSKIKVLTKLLEKYSGKKVNLNESAYPKVKKGDKIQVYDEEFGKLINGIAVTNIYKDDNDEICINYEFINMNRNNTKWRHYAYWDIPNNRWEAGDDEYLGKKGDAQNGVDEKGKFHHGFDELNETNSVSNKKQKIKVLIKLLEKNSGGKVMLKEADEAAKNQAVNNLQFIVSSIGNCIDKVNELYDIPVLNKESNIQTNILQRELSKVSDLASKLISNITGSTSEEQLEEDVTMTTDDIIKNPNAVKKLSDRKIDVRVKDDNSSTSRSSVSSSNVSMSSASF